MTTILFTAAWDDGGTRRTHELVARVEPQTPGLFELPSLAMEFKLPDIPTYRHTDVPVAPVRWVESDPAVLGSPFLVMDRVDGRVPGDDPPFVVGGWVVELAPADRALLFDNAIAVLAGIHALDVDALAQPGEPVACQAPRTPAAGRRLDELRRQPLSARSLTSASPAAAHLDGLDLTGGEGRCARDAPQPQVDQCHDDDNGGDRKPGGREPAATDRAVGHGTSRESSSHRTGADGSSWWTSAAVRVLVRTAPPNRSRALTAKKLVR
jgi:hypothetical protein